MTSSVTGTSSRLGDTQLGDTQLGDTQSGDSLLNSNNRDVYDNTGKASGLGEVEKRITQTSAQRAQRRKNIIFGDDKEQEAAAKKPKTSSAKDETLAAAKNSPSDFPKDLEYGKAAFT